LNNFQLKPAVVQFALGSVNPSTFSRHITLEIKVDSHPTVIATSLALLYQFDTKQYPRESEIEGVRYL
jgi:hypothetical protein